MIAVGSRVGTREHVLRNGQTDRVVAVAGEEQEIVRLSSGRRRRCEANRVCREPVVIVRAVDNQERPLEQRRVFGQAEASVALGEGVRVTRSEPGPSRSRPCSRLSALPLMVSPATPAASCRRLAASPCTASCLRKPGHDVIAFRGTSKPASNTELWVSAMSAWRYEALSSLERKGPVSRAFRSGRGWDRTSDPSRVKRVLSR